MNNSKITGIDYFLPEYVETNEQLSKIFPDWDYSSFEKKVGIKQRYIAGIEETSLDLAYRAAKKVINEDNRSKIDYVLFCTQSPDYFLPTGACILQDKLGLSTNIGALDINLGCSGYVYGLSLAKGLISANIAKCVLLLTAETYSKHIHKDDRTNRSIFGDAGAATIIEESDSLGIGEFVLQTDGSGFDKLIVKKGGFRNLSSVEDNTNQISKFPDNYLFMNGPDIFNFTIESIPIIFEQVLNANKMKLEDVDCFIFHQANAFMLNTLRRILKIPKNKFYINLSETANTVSSTIPIALLNAVEDDIVNVGDKVMLLGFGVGLSLGGTIIEI